MPAWRRDRPAWSAAAEKVPQLRVRSVAGTVPGSVLELPAEKVTEVPNRSPRVNSRKISAPAALKVLCPELYSGNGGGGKHVGRYGEQGAATVILRTRY